MPCGLVCHKGNRQPFASGAYCLFFSNDFDVWIASDPSYSFLQTYLHLKAQKIQQD